MYDSRNNLANQVVAEQCASYGPQGLRHGDPAPTCAFRKRRTTATPVLVYDLKCAARRTRICARTEIISARGNEGGVRRLFHCMAGGLSRPSR